MVKTPRTRHQKRQREPITINLAASEVKDEGAAAAQDVAAEAHETAAEAAGVFEAAAERRDTLLNDIDHNEAAASQPEPSEQISEPAPEYEPARESERKPEPTPGPTYSSEPPPPAARRGSGIAGGLIGAALALAGVMGLQWAGVMSSPGATAASTPATPPVSLAPVEAELAALKQELAALKAAPAPQAPAADPAIAASIESLKGELSQLQTAVQSGSGGDNAAVAALNSKLQELEASNPAQTIAALDAKVKELEAKATAPATEVTEKITSIEGQITVATEAITKSDGRISALEQSVAGLTGQVEQQASQPKVALAIAAAALKSAVDRGGPFTAELETLAAIAPSAAELEPLRPLAQAGVATEKTLIDSFGPVAEAMVAADVPPVDENAGLVSRLFDSARSVVKVRPVGEVAGEDAGARVARMEVAIKAGRFTDALTEYDAMPEAVKSAGAAYVAQVKGRLDATRLVDQLVANAMKAA